MCLLYFNRLVSSKIPLYAFLCQWYEKYLKMLVFVQWSLASRHLFIEEDIDIVNSIFNINVVVVVV